MRNFLLTFFVLLNQPVFLLAQNHFNITESFDNKPIPEKPNYEKLEFWASHPLKTDAADTLPKNHKKFNLRNNQADAAADVFYIYPTLYSYEIAANQGWNADIFDIKMKKEIDEKALPNQASVFNGSCKIYVPIYRQAHYSVFTTKDTLSSRKSLDLAYEDIMEAFKYYLENDNKGRPFFIYGHSQGTIHAARLIREHVENTPHFKNLVAAYLVGMPVSDKRFQKLKHSTEPSETGVYVSWNTLADKYYPPFYQKRYEGIIPINPITWTVDNNWSSKNEHKGLLGRNFKLKPKSMSAKIESGFLWIKKPDIPGAGLLNLKVWHFADINLFWLDIRENVALRLDSFMKNK